MMLKRIEFKDDTVTLEDLQTIKVLEQNWISNVFLCLSKANGKLYSLKTISNHKIQYYQLENEVNQEREVLMSLDHPMILKLIRTFKDDARVYFLSE